MTILCQEYTNGKFLICPVFENMTIEKNDDSKWFVDKSVSKLLDEDDKMYPPYCSGCDAPFDLH